MNLYKVKYIYFDIISANSLEEAKEIALETIREDYSDSSNFSIEEVEVNE